MATADEIRAEIAACEQQNQNVLAESSHAQQEIADAIVRQKLRRELEQKKGVLECNRDVLAWRRDYRRMIDSDAVGPHCREDEMIYRKKPSPESVGEVVRSEVDCNADVVTGEIEWTIKGFSWLEEALKQNEELCTDSRDMTVAGHGFRLVYHPEKGKLGGRNQRGSLAIFHCVDEDDDEGVTFRYTICIKSKERGYVQWGDPGNVCVTSAADCMVFGPDVCDSSTIPSGIFGMSHNQLVQSEWVIDDMLTAKLKVELRPECPLKDELKVRKVVGAVSVPPSNFCDDFLPLLDTAAGSDVTFNVQGDAIKAHSQILSARSEVLQRQFSCGMQESTSKEVTIQDCEPMIFRAFLRYLYCDSLASVESFIANDASSSSPAACTTSANGTKMSMLQQLLAISHKYQVARLQAWCEKQLCEFISIDEVCSVLLQAHLYEAKQLEKRCLEFIADNKDAVVKTEEFVSVSQHWPQVSLKICLCLGCVSEGSATTAMELQKNMRKRKRED